MARKSRIQLCFELICLGYNCLTAPNSTSVAASVIVVVVVTVGGGRVIAC